MNLLVIVGKKLFFNFLWKLYLELRGINLICQCKTHAQTQIIIILHHSRLYYKSKPLLCQHKCTGTIVTEM